MTGRSSRKYNSRSDPDRTHFQNWSGRFQEIGSVDSSLPEAAL